MDSQIFWWVKSQIFWGVAALFIFYGFLFSVIYHTIRKVGELEKKLGDLAKEADSQSSDDRAKESEESEERK